MVDLLNYKDNIKGFILTTFNKFTSEQYRPYVIGVYACPWAGWISLNFNITKDASLDSCPDFEFVEYDLISFEDWENALGHGDSEWIDANRNVVIIKWDDGDEILNQLFFNFLKSIVLEIKQTQSLPLVLIQMLDSEYNELVK